MNDEEGDDLPIIYKILAVAWILLMAVICYKADEREQEERSHRVERRMERNLQRIEERKLAVERRQALISAAIVTRKMTDNLGAGIMDQGGDMQEDNEDMTCAICLEPFDVGEELSFSRHLKCHHCFHSDCIVPWMMMMNDECPMCRTQLIFDDGKNEFNDNGFDDEDEISDDGFRIVNGLVRFASMLTNGQTTSEERVTSNCGMEMVGMNIDIAADRKLSSTSELSKYKRRTDNRNKENRKYAALPRGDIDSVDEEKIISNTVVQHIETEVV